MASQREVKRWRRQASRWATAPVLQTFATDGIELCEMLERAMRLLNEAAGGERSIGRAWWDETDALMREWRGEVNDAT